MVIDGRGDGDFVGESELQSGLKKLLFATA
jgi:hypothetical protein